MVEDRQTIVTVVKHGLCTGCGTCAGICPVSAIRMRIDERKGVYVPELIEDECNLCGICLDACPGYSIDLDGLNREIFGREPEDILLGNYIGCYLAHATDPEVRYNSASGGLVTSLLCFALEEGLIDGALVIKMRADNPLLPEPFIARTREDILRGTSSKYCPVPAGVALKEILEKEGKYAVVGLPCHIFGIRKAEAVSKTLRERLVVHLGIFCSHTVNFRATEYLLRKLSIASGELAGISYRGGGWPGVLKISLRNEDEKAIPSLGSLWNSIFGSFLFTPSCCLSCGDVTSELADLSFGDAWLPEIMRKGSTGESVVISRSERGEALLHAASTKGALELEDMNAADVVRSQRLFLHFKKVNISYRTRLQKVWRRRGDAVTGSETSICNYVVGAIAIMNSRVGASRFGAFLLKAIPLKALSVYTNAFYRYYFRVITKDFDELR